MSAVRGARKRGEKDTHLLCFLPTPFRLLLPLPLLYAVVDLADRCLRELSSHGGTAHSLTHNKKYIEKNGLFA